MRALLQDDGKIQKTRTNPEFFGEISLLSDDNRITATAIARTNCECYTLQVRAAVWSLYLQLSQETLRPCLNAVTSKLAAIAFRVVSFTPLKAETPRRYVS
eukprot:COSAG02_NODE_30596_length_548_cov_1.162584_2_plen_100_part_01